MVNFFIGQVNSQPRPQRTPFEQGWWILILCWTFKRTKTKKYFQSWATLFAQLSILIFIHSEATTRGVLWKKMFLEISQIFLWILRNFFDNSHKNSIIDLWMRLRYTKLMINIVENVLVTFCNISVTLIWKTLKKAIPIVFFKKLFLLQKHIK